ncbi:MAG: hypothetical protein E7372_03850 [Clostridiales bacterium]|nr:hypothetical protein [Clostridiales bacterium]
MNRPIQVGDLVISLTGRDKDKCFLVIESSKTRVKIVDGKTHKQNSPKTKNIKHVKQILTTDLNEFVENIKQGKLVSNRKVYKLINAKKQKLQED